jgi:hypothetical protein
MVGDARIGAGREANTVRAESGQRRMARGEKKTRARHKFVISAELIRGSSGFGGTEMHAAQVAELATATRAARSGMLKTNKRQL